MSGGRDIDLQGLRVLVVEDHSDAANMVGTMLSAQNAQVVLARDGREALEGLQSDARAPGQDVVDLVISDLQMPNMDGFALIQAMREDPALAGIPAIALTAFTRGGDRARALNYGFRHHVAKPVDPEELLAVVGAVLDRLS